MKRIILAIIALLSLVVGFAQFNDEVPISIQRFMDERSDRERVMKSNRAQTLAYEPQFAPTRLINGVEMADAFIGIENHSVISTLERHGVIVNCEFDGFVTAQIPVKELSRISRLPGVTEVEISRMVKLATDTTLRVTHAGQVLNGTQYGLPQAYDGSGVVIGIIDTGFDYQHIAFRRTDDPSQTRIVRVYDPMDSTGHEARIGDKVLPGTVFMGEQIDTMTYNSGTHGTHVAGIATGMHVGGYGGMAPGADIVMCVCRNLNLYIPETEVANSIKYIFSYADSVGKPCVINVSVSTTFGPHDGSDWISRAVAQTSGPGRIFVIAAGNTGSRYFYAYGPSTMEKPLSMLMSCYPEGQGPADFYYYYKYTWFDIWIRNPRTRPVAQLHIFDTFTRRIVWKSDLITLFKKINASEFDDYFVPNQSVDSEGYLQALISQTSSGKYELQAYAYNLKTTEYTIDGNGNYVSRYRIGVTVYPPKIYYPNQTDSIYLDSWTVQGNLGSYGGIVYTDEISENGDTVAVAHDGFYRWPSDNCSIGSFAVHDSIISAGAFVGRNSFYSLPNHSMQYDYNAIIGGIFNLSSYESPGFGPTGKALPTVMAPGFDVVSSASRYSYFLDWGGHPNLVMRTDDGYIWGVMSGTSLAAPTVAGIIAQWLQINPNLSPGNIKDIIAHTAVKDAFTLDPNNGVRFGPNGKIDAMAGARYILAQMGEDVMYGDVNDDGFVNITDAVVLINFLSREGSDETPVIHRVNSDMNQDGFINITDVVLLVNHLSNAAE